MSTLSKAAVAAGVFGTLFICYCIYFDRKRRSDPDFKKKLKERRIQNRLAEDARTASRAGPMPDLRDHEAVQAFFLREVQLGEELLGRGDVDGGIDHLCNAVAVCGQPNQLLQVLQQTLPPNVFQTLLKRLPAVSRRLDQNKQQASPAGMAEEDVE